MTKNKWLTVCGAVIIIIMFSVAGYSTLQNKATVTVVTSSPAQSDDMHTISLLKVTYQLSSATQQLYTINVVGQSSGDIAISGKACNSMSGTIQLLAKGKTTTQTVVKTLNDGRIVLQPQIMSTLMACLDTTPATDDAALNKVFEDIAASLQSY